MDKKRVLVVDDEEPLIELLRANLELLGHEVLVAEDGEEGLRMALAQLPDLVILDVNLPKLVGFEVCRRMKADDDARLIPVLMLSAMILEGDVKRGLHMGADAYMKKPFSVNELTRTVQKLLKVVPS